LRNTGLAHHLAWTPNSRRHARVADTGVSATSWRTTNTTFKCLTPAGITRTWSTAESTSNKTLSATLKTVRLVRRYRSDTQRGAGPGRTFPKLKSPPPNHNGTVRPARQNFTIVFEFEKARVDVSEELIYTEASKKRRSAMARCSRQVQCHCELAKVYTLRRTGKLRLVKLQ
jgi:hypothetical protein